MSRNLIPGSQKSIINSTKSILTRRLISSSSSSLSSSTTSTSNPTSDINPTTPPPSSSTSSSSSSIRAALLLSRPPTILREPTNLETNYFKYNQKLKFNLSQPFPKDFYFKKGSASETRFEIEEESRRKEFSGILNSSNTNTNTKENKTNKKIGSKKVEEENQAESETATSSNNPDEDLYKTQSRKTIADQENDLKSLERNLDQNLWLFVKEGKSNHWRLPSKIIGGKDGEKELLHKAAPSALTSILGSEMDLWLISNLPVGLIQKGQGVSEKTYVLPAHILSGSPSLELAKKNGIEFLWLTKDEAKERFGNGGEENREYWSRIEGLLD